MNTQSSIGLSGGVIAKVIRSPKSIPPEEIGLRGAAPRPGLSQEVNSWRARNLPNLWRGFRRVMAARMLRLPHFYGQLSIAVGRCTCGCKTAHSGICPHAEWTDYGLASMRVVTTAGVNFLVDAIQNLVEPETLKYHAIGTGVGAEAVGDTALGTELTTEYNPDNTRATGTLTEGASANIFRTVGTNTVDAVVAITEHGILTQAATGGGTLLDRSKFAAVNLASGDSIQTTYDLTLTAGS